ncbi:MAG: Zn-ribbon domain-containing OB-fold protein [Candidatus Binatia bacterium]
MQEPPQEPVKYVDTNVYLPYHYIAGDYRARFFAAMKNKKFLGSKCEKTGKVFVSPLVNSPESFAPCTEFVELEGRGVITTFCIVNIPVMGRDLQLPYVAASVALDGADISIFAAIQEVKADEARMGMRVEAVWKPDGERTGSFDDVQYFRPTGEPDAKPETYINRL